MATAVRATERAGPPRSLEREKNRRGKDQGKWERSLKRLEWEIKSLQMLAEKVGLWHRL